MNGKVYTSPVQENEVSLVESQVNDRLQEMSDEMLVMILELIHAVRSSSDPISSVIFRKLLSGRPIVSTALNEKYVLRLSLELYKQR